MTLSLPFAAATTAGSTSALLFVILLSFVGFGPSIIDQSRRNGSSTLLVTAHGVVAGAWLGGTLDTSAAVVAGGELISDAARDAAVVVKLSQNALIGVAAFLLTVWWTLKRKTEAGAEGTPRTSLAVIWERFPKFVFGFLVASIVFSWFVGDATVADTRGPLTAIRTTLFAMAFVSIGLETSLGTLVTTDQGRPALAFLGAQAFNILVTFAAAYVFFGGFPFAP